jgi:hypothetical protein
MTVFSFRVCLFDLTSGAFSKESVFSTGHLVEEGRNAFLEKLETLTFLWLLGSFLLEGLWNWPLKFSYCPETSILSHCSLKIICFRRLYPCKCVSKLVSDFLGHICQPWDWEIQCGDLSISIIHCTDHDIHIESESILCNVNPTSW